MIKNLRVLKNDNMSVKVIFDNGGGTVMQLGNFKHYYNTGEQAAVDYYTYLQDDNTDIWDGHDDEINMHVEPESIHNGGCIVCYEDDIADFLDNYNINEDENFSFGKNQTEFIKTLNKIIKEVGNDTLLYSTFKNGKIVLFIDNEREVTL